MISGILTHLWQSTLFAGGAWFLTLALRKNAASVRYRVLLIASLKFLVPFSLLVGVGSLTPHREAPVPLAEAKWVAVAAPLVAPAAMVRPVAISPATADYLPVLLFTSWACGFAVIAIYWLSRWKRADAMCRSAALLKTCSGVPVMSVDGATEPGVFGIFRQVLILPGGIEEHLDGAQMDAILAHELCHVRRRDNLTAALHMIVQAIFWFHPLVWWLGTRLMEERELACDEEVLRLGWQPQVYAAAILSVCKLYVETPLACVAGISGMNLRKRIEAIVAKRTAFRLNFARKTLLACAAIIAALGPVAVGVLHLPTVQAQTAGSGTRNTGDPVFAAATIKPSDPDLPGYGTRISPGQFLASSYTLRLLILYAYDLSRTQVLGGPAWLDSDRYNIAAKPEGDGVPTLAQWKTMLQKLLADRFGLSFHRETRTLSVYALTVARGGPKLTPAGDSGDAIGDINFYALGKLGAKHASMADFVHSMQKNVLDLPVVDQTGLSGRYDFALNWVPDEFQFSQVRTSAGSQIPSNGDGDGLFVALERQLGLQIKATKAPAEVIVVDGAQMPSEN